jgi:FKBP-type peptidyl-prolyl cis-trans isomerase FklB
MADMRKPLLAFLFVLAWGMALAVSPAAAQGTPPGQPAQATAPKPAATPGTPSQPAPAFKSQKDEVSYALGLTWGTNLRKESVEIEPEILLQGLKDAMAGGKTQMTEDEARNALVKFQNDLKTRDAEKSRSEGDAYRAANKAKEGVVTLPSGLQYKILVAGTGPKPMLTDQVTCNYRGTLIDGTEFDSSYKRGEPATFPVNRVIKGWTEALQLMPVGSKWQLVISPELAYGPGGRPGIPPNATLVFEVELISIVVKQPGQPATPR